MAGDGILRWQPFLDIDYPNDPHARLSDLPVRAGV